MTLQPDMTLPRNEEPAAGDATDGDSTDEASRGEPETRCGYVVLLGAPNVGKSTLLNALVGERLSSVTPKAQTTWRRVTGILTSGSSQFVFLDTPGVLRPSDLLQRSLLGSARGAAREADVLVLIADPLNPLSKPSRELLLQVAAESRGARLGVVNKVDAATPAAIELESDWLRAEGRVREVLPVSARDGAGVGTFLERLGSLLPPGPFLFPEDEIASDPVRDFVAEMVRETIFEEYEEEVPYSAFCQVEEFRTTDENRTYIQVNVYLERASQKGILIGEKGRAIRNLGIRSREKIEAFLETPVYLDLWVKVLPRWRKKKEQLRRLGIPVPEEDENSSTD